MTTDVKTNERWNKSGLKEWTAVRAEIDLTGGNVADVFKVRGGPCRIIAMFLEITEAVANTACNMSWILDSDTGGDRVIADTVNIQAAALGDFFVAELDGTNLVKITTATGVPHGYFYPDSATNGTIVTEGGIDVVLSATPATGKGTLWVYYRPLVFNAAIAA